MDSLTKTDLTVLFLALGTLLLTARVLGEVAKRYNQPAVLGEILAGILLGPTVLGAFAPAVNAFLFPVRGGAALALDGLTTLAIVLFLLVAGMEVDLSTVWRQGKVAVGVALAGMALPFAFGLAAGWFLPEFFGFRPGSDRLAFALFLATALSITALPIIAKILIDLKIYRSDLGVTVVAAAVLNDLIGWLVFAVILGLLGADPEASLGIGPTIMLTVGFTAAMLTVVPWLIHRLLPWVQAYTSWPGGVLGFALAFTLFCAAFTEWIGIHAIFGSFLAGVAIGHSRHLREQTRNIIDQFVSFIFAPLFFASIGLRVNFAAHFDPLLTLTVLGLALLGKVPGSALGARLGGMSWRESWGIGFGMSAQGTMGIILGLLALRFGLIGQQLFVSLVVMALATSLLSGPMLKSILRLRQARRFTDHLPPRGFVPRLAESGRPGTIRELSAIAAEVAGLDSEGVAQAVLERERIMATGIGNAVAVPHARLRELDEPLVVVGLSTAGVDFDAPDGHPAHIICLILTPAQDDGAQLEILADIAATFRHAEAGDSILKVEGYTEFLGLVKSLRTG